MQSRAAGCLLRCFVGGSLEVVVMEVMGGGMVMMCMVGMIVMVVIMVVIMGFMVI